MNEELYLTFENYLSNEISLEEKTTFEQQLQSNSEIAAAFETYKNWTHYLEHKIGHENERNAFQENLKTISKKSHKSKVFQLQKFYFAVAAIFALLFGLVYINQNSTPTFEDFDSHENAYFTERGTIEKNLKLAQEAFNNKDYKSAIPFFEICIKENSNPEIDYFYGVSLLKNNHIEAAEKVFEKLKSGTSVYKTKAIWNLALSKLKQKDYKSCRKILLTIPTDYENYDQVQKLLKALQ